MNSNNIIQRNANGFDFVDTLGSFINNQEFSTGFNQYKQGQNNKNTYIWKVLSAIGNQYAETIYENVLNYIDNVSNIDLCKVKALQSMMNVVGMNYDILPMLNTVPVEIANLMDILSINRRYLLDSKTFKKEFIDLLSANGCIKTANVDSELSTVSTDPIEQKLDYVDEEQYDKFLQKIYSSALMDFVYMKYADAENGISSTTYTYIYEYLQDEILASQADASDFEQTEYQTKMTQMKLRYGIDKDFNQEQIVDNIEYGYDSITNYNTFQQYILSAEIDHRKNTYSFDKPYLSNDVTYGYNLTRYSYYRERKVKEYFKFIEDTYNSLLTEENIKNAVDNVDDNVTINEYDKDPTYFDIDITEKKRLLEFNENDKVIELNTSYIEVIAQLLAHQTIDIANLRDQLKIQIRKSYMRGTWLLMSYLINEYLKYDICDRYGEEFETDDGVYLKTILSTSLMEEGNKNIRLIEYYDPTEYFNITHEDTDAKALNGDSTNKKFWDNIYNKIGVNSNSLPLDEIDAFYKDQLKMRANSNVDNVVEFLSIIYEYGANDSYIDKTTGQYMAKIPGQHISSAPTYVGDTYSEISSRQNYIAGITTITDEIDKYVSRGYPQATGNIMDQLSSLSSFVSSYFDGEIHSTNDDIRQSTIDQKDSDLEEVMDFANKMNEISSSYEALKANPNYQNYISLYKENDSDTHFINKLSTFALSVTNENGFSWDVSGDVGNGDISILTSYLETINSDYNNLRANLFNKLFSLSVNEDGYWKEYLPSQSDAITSITTDLKTYLIDKTATANEDQKTRIYAILSSISAEYNIRYFDCTVQLYQANIRNVLHNNSLYFSEFTNNETDRIDNQICSIYNYIFKKTDEVQAEISAEIDTLSSDYDTQLTEFIPFANSVSRNEVENVNDDLTYELSTINFNVSIGNEKYLDVLLNDSNYGIIPWLNNVESQFDATANRCINRDISSLTEYKDTSSIINLAVSVYVPMISDDSSRLLVDKFDSLADQLSNEINYIESNKDHYDESHQIYLKYNGTEIGYDPFYNYKNMAYSSYQIHPYLYNFIEKSNIEYPLAEAFFNSFSEEYEKELYEKGIDNIIGQYGNIKNAWKSELFDWTSYQSTYENIASKQNDDSNPIVGFTGLFYPPALKALMENSDEFLQNVQDNTPQSYYYHLNFSHNQCQKTYEQLLAYSSIIRYVATAQETNDLSCEFDIYKYVEDCMGNQIFLLKSYKHLYEKHADESGYSPSYHEKRNTLGEIWMRPKNHPLAFPAFDLRKGYEDISLYSIKKKVNSYAEDINSYILSANNIFSKCEEYSDSDILETGRLTRDTIFWEQTQQRNDGNGIEPVPANDAQHLRCFFDFETDYLNRSLLVVVPLMIGSGFETTYSNNVLKAKYLRYADSSIIIGHLGKSQLFNATSDQTYVYNFSSDLYADSIENPYALVNGAIVSGLKNSYYEFIGFAKRIGLTYAIFIEKHTLNKSLVYDASCSPQYSDFTFRSTKISKPRLVVHYSIYKERLDIIKGVVESDNLGFDCYNWYIDNDKRKNCDYHNASNIALACNSDELLTIGFISERTNPKVVSSDGSADYKNNVRIVNFTEYSNQVESYNATEDAGMNLDYPKSTALIQTTDYQHINIYNSFDSFTQYLMMVDFSFVGSRLRYKQTKYYNLNSDIGYLPQYVDVQGQSYYCNNRALSNLNHFDIELLGPEKSDIEFSPVINITTDEKFGRVTEDYIEFTKLSSNNDLPLSVLQGDFTATYTFDLSTIYISNVSSLIGLDRAKIEYDNLYQTDELLSYKYILYNSNYLALPILKGNLSALHHNGYYYKSEEKYDMLSGEEIYGPNMTTYQNVNMTNHIDNISAIGIDVLFDEHNNVPSALQLSVQVRQPNIDSVMEIDKNQFYLLIYTKNNVRSYQYYHLFENPNTNVSAISADQLIQIDLTQEGIDLSKISVDLNGQTYYPLSAINPTDEAPLLSAALEFKYTENDPIMTEFPTLDQIDVEDEIVIVENDNQSIYFFAVDDYSSLELDAFQMRVYVPSWTTNRDAYSYNKKINPALTKYKDFFNKSLTIEATYNMEKCEGCDDNNPKYENVLYFNYKNFTNPQYVNISWPSNDLNDPTPPVAYSYDSSDDAIKHTYLVLKPGQTGRLDLIVDFIEYQKLSPTAINQSIVGAYSKVIKSYYIMNVSDEKPKFRIQRTPFTDSHYVIETDNYELEQ